jgi:single-strand DNA-binding protein
MNKIILSGNLCKDIEVRYTTTNKPVVANTIAVKNDFKNADGNYESEFINIVLWNNQAEYLSKYAEKGSKVLVEGRLTNREYTKQDGTKGYVTEVIVNSIEILDRKKDGQAPRKDTYNDLHTTTSSDDSAFADFGETIELSEEDIAF